MNQTNPLPPDTRYRNGQLVRSFTVDEDGKPRRMLRPVALTLEEAKARLADFYDQDLGWIRAGKKMEREHPLVSAGAMEKAGIIYDYDDEDEGDKPPEEN